MSDDVREGFASGTAGEEGAEFGQSLFGKRSVKLEVEFHSLASESMSQQMFGIEPGFGYSAIPEERFGFFQNLEEGMHGC